MVGKLFRRFRLLLAAIVIVSGSWALTQWTANEEIIVIDGKKVTVIDGDSFKDADAEYRVHGIDAPEYRQSCKDASQRDWPCGKAARTALETALRSGQYRCDVHARDQYGRLIVTCVSGDKDLGAYMVEQGHAISYGGFDQMTYGFEEARAEKAKRGIWQGAFETPANWRAAHPR